MKKTLFLSAILATALCSSAFAFNSTTTTIDGTTYNGDVWTWNNLRDGADVSDNNCVYTNFTTGDTYTGRADGTSAGYANPFYKVFQNDGETQYVGNTFRFDGATASIRLNTDWSNSVYVGGVITTASSVENLTYTLGRANSTTFRLNGTGAVNMTLDSNFYLSTNTNIYVEKGGTWNIANGKTLTMRADGSDHIKVSDNQAVQLAGAGTLSLSSNMILGSGSSLSFSSSNKIAGTGKFDGSGTLELGCLTGQFNNKFADTWTGTVVLTGNAGDGMRIDYLGTTNSLVEFKGATGGYDSQWKNGTVTHNVRFTDVDGSAWAWGAYGTNSDHKMTFSGTIDGNGHIVTNNGAENRAQGFAFTGDISGWTGGIRQDGAGRHTVTFSGNATTVNAELIKHASGNIYLVVDNTADTTFSAAQTVTNVTVQGGGKATFGAVTASEMRVKDNSTLVLTDTNYGAEIKGYSGYVGMVEVKGQTANTTIRSIYQDANGNTDGVIKLILNNGHKTSVSNWVTVQEVTLKSDSDLQLSYHNIGELNVESGSNSTVFSSMNIGADNQHKLDAVSVNAGATLTFNRAGNASVQTLTLGAGATMTLGSAASHNHDLTTTTLTVDGNSTLNANLVVLDNGTMDFSKHTELTMGCTVTIGDNVTIKIDDSELASIVNTGSVMTIITDVEGVNMDNLALTLGSGWNFVDAQGNSLDAYNLRLDVVNAGDGKVNIVVAPEPATATLSLLALAALASRRKRH